METHIMGRTTQRLREAMTSQTWLRSLPEDLFNHLLARSNFVSVPRHAPIVRQGQAPEDLLVLLRGRAQAVRLGLNDRPVLLEVIQPGDRIGELSLVDGEPHSATVHAVQPCQLLLLPGQDVLRCLQQSPAMAHALLLEMVQRLRRSNKRVSSLALHTVHDRVLATLVEGAVRNEAGEWLVSGGANRLELAQLVGASREMVSRVLQTMTQSGQIEIRRGPHRGIVLRHMPPEGPPG